MGKANAKTGSDAIGKKIARAALLFWNSVLWVVVLGVILGISGYSLYHVARLLGVPVVFAYGMSTVFDGSALITAGLAIRYAEEGMSGGGPRTFVRFLALLSAYIQALHVILGHENKLAIPLWSSLPIIAMVDFEFQTKWIRRKYLARQGMTYPSQLPTIGVSSWILYFRESKDDIKVIVKGRKDALIAAAKLRMADFVDATETDMGERKKARRTKPKSTISHLVEDGSCGPEPTQPERPAETEESVSETDQNQDVNGAAANGDGTEPAKTETERPNGTEQTDAGDELSVRRTERNAHAPNRHKRNWVREQGFEVPLSGRTPQWVIEMYDEAHKEKEA